MALRIKDRIRNRIIRYWIGVDCPGFQLKFLEDNGYKNRYFLDCGANNGCSVRKFRNEIDVEKRYHIYSFEPNPAFLNCFLGFENHTFIPKAVWTANENITFYDTLRDDKYGGTVREDKNSGEVDYTNPIEVAGFDFSSWVASEFSDDDFVILKLDIESAEYDVLPKMIKDGSLSKINLFFVEWHFNKVKVQMKKHRSIVKALRSLNIAPYDWHAADYI
jgi:FkbM family methyltransferase